MPDQKTSAAHQKSGTAVSGGYVQNMAWPGMAWPLLACQILSFVLCKNVSRNAIETKTHEVLKLGVRK